MEYASVVFSFLSMILNLYVLLKLYECTTETKIAINFLNVTFFILLLVIEFLGNYYFSTFGRLIVSYLIIFLAYKYYFKDRLLVLLFKFFLICLLLTICDFLISTVFLFFPISSSIDLGNITFIKSLGTILLSLILWLLISIPIFVKFLTKLVNYIVRKWNIITLILAFLIFLVFIILSYINGINFRLEIFIISSLSMLFFLFLCVIMIYQYFSNKHQEEEQKALLDLMDEYEKILETDRMNKHEILNNLVILKSYKNKSSKEYEEILDGIIEKYEINKFGFYSKLYKLPTGIKGIIYYKISNIKNKKLNIELFLSPKVKSEFEKLNSRLYFRACKILGIIIDNAFEAASNTNEKVVIFDIYLEDDFIVFYLENSFNNNLNLDNINNKGVSSKGTNRGYGLFIANKLVKENSDISLEQYVKADRFVSILKIKNL